MLGVQIGDTCDNNEFAIRSWLQFDLIKKKRGFFGVDRLVRDGIKIPDTVAVVGPKKSTIRKKALQR